MRLFSVSGDPEQPCLVLKMKKTMIMLDCGLDINLSLLCTTPHRLVSNAGGREHTLPAVVDGSHGGSNGPTLRRCPTGQVLVDGGPGLLVPDLDMVQMGNIDAVLLTCATNMWALPYITEHTAFRGAVYATPPTKAMGRLYLLELAHYLAQVPRNQEDWLEQISSSNNNNNSMDGSSHPSLPPYLVEAMRWAKWCKPYTIEDVERSVAKIQPVAYNEAVDLFGVLRVTASSTAYTLGGSLWTLEDTASAATAGGGGAPATLHEPGQTSSIQEHVKDKVVYIGRYSVYTSHGLPLDKSAFRDPPPKVVITSSMVMGKVPGPDAMCGETAKASLAHACVFPEWLAPDLSKKVYLAEEPFVYSHMQKIEKLKVVASLSALGEEEFQTPCVVFAGHPTLRTGDTVHLMDLWAGNRKNAVIFTDATVPYAEALAPYQPMAMQALHFPIETRNSVLKANRLLQNIKMDCCVTAEVYRQQPPPAPPAEGDLGGTSDFLDPQCPQVVTYRTGDIVKIPWKKCGVRVAEVEQDVLEALHFRELRPGLLMASLSAGVKSVDNRLILTHQAVEDGPSSGQQPQHSVGDVDPDKLVKGLQREGFDTIGLKMRDHGFTVTMDTSLIQVDQAKNHISVSCEGEEARGRIERALRSADLRV